eukprot:scaffold175321_cov29-Attheya_sp.AAC.1
MTSETTSRLHQEQRPASHSLDDTRDNGDDHDDDDEEEDFSDAEADRTGIDIYAPAHILFADLEIDTV